MENTDFLPPSAVIFFCGTICLLLHLRFQNYPHEVPKLAFPLATGCYPLAKDTLHTYVLNLCLVVVCCCFSTVVVAVAVVTVIIAAAAAVIVVVATTPAAVCGRVVLIEVEIYA